MNKQYLAMKDGDVNDVNLTPHKFYETDLMKNEETQNAKYKIEQMREKFKRGFLESKKQLKKVVKLNEQYKEDEIQKLKTLRKKEEWRQMRLKMEEKGRNLCD